MPADKIAAIWYQPAFSDSGPKALQKVWIRPFRSSLVSVTGKMICPPVLMVNRRVRWSTMPAPKEPQAVSAAPVTTGAYGSETVPVLSGVGAGDWVVAAGGHLLRAGQPVIAVDRQNRPVLKPAAPPAAAKAKE